MSNHPRVLARDQIRIAATLLGLPMPFVRQVTQRLKSDGRLPATRPVTTAVTPESLARLLLGLCTPLPSKSTDLEISLGKLPRATGDGADTAVLELEALIAEAAGITNGDTDFWHGDLLIGVTTPVVHFSVVKFDGTASTRTYRASSGEDDRLTRYVRVPLQTLRVLALELMGE